MPDKLTTLITSKLAAGAPPQSPALPDESAQKDSTRAAISRTMRVGLWTLGIGFGGFLLWAAFAPLDEGVPANAMVSIDTKRKPVQHQTGGIVKEVLVKEGSIVAAGQTPPRRRPSSAPCANSSLVCGPSRADSWPSRLVAAPSNSTLNCSRPRIPTR